MAQGDFGDSATGSGSRFAYAPVLQLTGRVGYYDQSAKDEEFGLAPFRGQDFGFVATITTAGGRTFLEIDPLAAPLELYNVGSGGAGGGAGLPGTQTDAESSAGPEGGIVRNQATFVTVGLMVERLSPWCTAEGSADVLTQRDSADFLDGAGDGGPRYGVRLQEQVEQAANFLMEVAGGTRKVCQEHMGPISDWLINPVSRLNLPGHFWMFSSDYGSGGQNSDMEMTMFVEQTRTIRVEQNAALPFLAGQQVVVPYRVRQIGYTLCGDPEDEDGVCATKGRRARKGGMSPTEVQSMIDDAADKAAEKAAGAVMRRMNRG